MDETSICDGEQTSKKRRRNWKMKKSRKISKYEILVLDLVLGHNGYLQKLEAGGGWMGAGHNLQLNFDQ